MKEPVLQDKHVEHGRFRRYAEELIELVSGATQRKDETRASDASIQSIHKVRV